MKLGTLTYEFQVTEEEQKLREYYPEAKFSTKIMTGFDKFRRAWVGLDRKGSAKYIPLSDDDFVRIGKGRDGKERETTVKWESLPKDIKDSLGPKREDVLKRNEEE